MIRIRRPAATVSLSAKVRAALAKRQQSANKLPVGDPKIGAAWGNFLSSKPKSEVATALDACFRYKCAYCEGVAAQDIEHFYPKTQYPDRMFDWDNFLRGCKNCNNFKRDRFPVQAG
jgi:5-methylcytosine-specific restriction endonuclease McrA